MRGGRQAQNTCCAGRAGRALLLVLALPAAALAVVRGMATIAADGTRRPLTHGRIQLQSEGAETWFRAITIEPIRAMPRIVVEP